MPFGTRNLSILFFALVVVMLGFGMIIPILPFYIDAFGASGSALGLLMATFATMQFIFAPLWGRLSDRIGRKPVLIIGLLGNALSMLLFGLSTRLWMLYVFRGLSGVLSSATMPSAMAYVGDSTSEKQRGGGMGLMGAAMGLGMVLGPGLGGWLGNQSLARPFFLATGLSLLAAFFVLLVLPESLQPENRNQRSQQASGSRFNKLWLALRGPLGILFVLAFLISFGLTNFESVFGLYALERFGYGPQRVGTILTFIGLTSAVIQGGLAGPLTRRFGEVPIIRFCLFGSAIGFVLMLLAYDFITVVITSSLFVMSNALLRPGISALISLRSPTGQGIAMGLNNSFMSLGRIAGPIFAGLLFDANLNLPYLAGSLVMLLGLLVSLVWLQKQALPNQTTQKSV
ncbi:MAG: MFS transporter [Anaerolineales bacterium]|nr:MFS transporter [Anaerolineales bacterium]